jgi:hypothetical protein
MLAHKKGYNPLLDGGEPSPPSHIKAVFGTREDKEFYGPMAGVMGACVGGEGSALASVCLRPSCVSWWKRTGAAA